MHVYVVSGIWEFEGAEVIAVFATEADAEDFAAKCREDGGKDPHSGDKLYYDGYLIESHELVGSQDIIANCSASLDTHQRSC